MTKDEKALYMREWRKNNKEEVKEYNAKRRALYPEKAIHARRAWYVKNRQKSIDAAQKWRNEHLGRATEAHKKWCKANLEHVREWRKKWIASKPAEYSILVANRWRKKHPSKWLFCSIRSRSKMDGIEFNLEPEDCLIPETCPVFGFKLEPAWGKKHQLKNSPSVDRIDNTKGYIKGNIRVISSLANRMKTDATPTELKQFAEWVLKTI